MKLSFFRINLFKILFVSLFVGGLGNALCSNNFNKKFVELNEIENEVGEYENDDELNLKEQAANFFFSFTPVNFNHSAFENNSPVHKLDKRQLSIEALSKKLKFEFIPFPALGLLKFTFVDHELTLATKNGYNLLLGKKHFYQLMIADITYERYDGLAKETEKMTVALVSGINNKHLPDFLLEKHNIFSFLEVAKGFKDINFSEDPVFSKKYFLRGKDETNIRKMFNNPNLLSFLDKNDHYSIQSINGSILFHRYGKLLSSNEIEEMIDFVEEFMLI